MFFLDMRLYLLKVIRTFCMWYKITNATKGQKRNKSGTGDCGDRTHNHKHMKIRVSCLRPLGHLGLVKELGKSLNIKFRYKFRVQKFSLVPIFLLKSTRSILLTMASYRYLLAVKVKKLSHFLPLWSVDDFEWTKINILMK